MHWKPGCLFALPAHIYVTWDTDRYSDFALPKVVAFSTGHLDYYTMFTKIIDCRALHHVIIKPRTQ